MAVSMHRIAPGAHLPLVLGVLRKLNVAQLTDTLLTSRVTSSGRKSVRASTGMPYETSEAHLVSINRRSGATDSVRSTDSGRNEVVVRRRQGQWQRRGLASLKVPNTVRNERLW